MNKYLLPLFVVLGTATLSAQSFDDAVRQSQVRLEQAQQELEALNEEIIENKPQLAAELDQLEDEAVRLRSAVSDASRIRSSVDVEVSQLQQSLRDIRENNNYIQTTLLNDYFRRFENNIDEAEIPMYRDQIREALELLEVDDRQDDDAIFRQQLSLVDAALTRLGDSIGGKIISGEAAVSGGTVRQGNFVVVGPLSYFLSDNGEVAGISRGIHANRANIFPLPGHIAGVASVIQTGEGQLPIDASDGEAWESEEHSMSLMEELYVGGFVMIPILLLIVWAVIVAAYKTVELFSIKAAKESDLHQILNHIREGRRDEALAYAKNLGGPVGQMLTAAVENADQHKEVIEEILYEKIINTQPKLERYLSVIAVAAATSPLLGLLGTVTGMIRTFNLITILGTGDARNFASGISEALITTKWGLLVAIPTLIVHALLSRKARSVVGSMEQSAVGFINGIEEIRNSQKDVA